MSTVTAALDRALAGLAHARRLLPSEPKRADCNLQAAMGHLFMAGRMAAIASWQQWAAEGSDVAYCQAVLLALDCGITLLQGIRQEFTCQELDRRLKQQKPLA